MSKRKLSSPMPEHVQIGPFTFTVRAEEHAINRQAVKDRTNLDGAVDYANQEILIKPGQHPDSEQDSVLHECLHIVLSQWSTGLDEDAEEKIVAGLSIHLLDLMHRNPHLIEYLMARTG